MWKKKSGYWSETIKSTNNFICEGYRRAEENSVVDDVKVKEMLIPYVTGYVVIFYAFGI